MKLSTTATFSIASQLALALTIGCFASNSMAQQVYRIVGPDGRITFSDQPPPSSSNAKVTSGVGYRGGADNSATALPPELREPASKYPVTLYTGNNCGPCSAGKAFLAGRGIPFAEKTVTSQEDVDALQRLSSDAQLPFLTIGGQQLKGYSDTEWGQFLDAAGYPKASVLPAGYRSPPPTPLVATKKPDATGTATTAAADGSTPPARRTAPAARPAPVPQDNPAGIKF